MYIFFVVVVSRYFYTCNHTYESRLNCHHKVIFLTHKHTHFLCRHYLHKILLLFFIKEKYLYQAIVNFFQFLFHKHLTVKIKVKKNRFLPHASCKIYLYATHQITQIVLLLYLWRYHLKKIIIFFKVPFINIFLQWKTHMQYCRLCYL